MTAPAASTWSPIFGRLTLESIPYHEPILIGTFSAVALGGIAVDGKGNLFAMSGNAIVKITLP